MRAAMDLGPTLVMQGAIVVTPKGPVRLKVWPMRKQHCYGELPLRGNAWVTVRKDEITVPLWRLLRARAYVEAVTLRRQGLERAA